MRRFVVFAALLAVSACASAPSQNQQAVRSHFQETIPNCQAPEHCSALWDAAQIWVVKHAAYKIQTATNVLIETFTSTDTELSARVLKEPNGQGGYKFTVYVWCGNPFGCFPDPWATAQDFNDTLNAIPAPTM